MSTLHASQLRSPWKTNGCTYGYNAQGERICTGAKMGRSDEMPAGNHYSTPVKLRLVKVRLNGDYDAGGAYWGRKAGFNLYCALGFIGPAKIEIWTRGPDRAYAKLQIRQKLRCATFFN